MDEAALATVLKSAPADLDAALQASLGPGITTTAIKIAAMVDDAALPAKILEILANKNATLAFEAALNRRRTPSRPADIFADTHVDPQEARRFFDHTVSARCRIVVDGEFRGSGCLVGPSLVLTAAHVVMKDTALDDTSNIMVKFYDGKSERVVSAPAVWAAFAEHDTAPDGSITPPFNYGNRDDFVLLRLARPSGTRYANVRLPDKFWNGNVGATIFILHFPDGQDQGIGTGRLIAVTDPAERWRYEAQTAGGSSGGPCFNGRFSFIGIHQGKWPPGRRLVPLARIIDRIRPLVANDYAPQYLWSLTGTPSGDLVVGRDDLFLAFERMVRPSTRLRGLRVKRMRPEGSTTGLGFTVQVLSALAERNATAGISLLSYGWPGQLDPGFDLLDSLEASFVSAGWLGSDYSASSGLDGARVGETGNAGALVAKAEHLVRAVHDRAEREGRIRWLIVENPEGPVGPSREALEALARAFLLWPTLRIVLIGLETVTTPGDEYDFANEPTGPTDRAGFLTEWFGEFLRDDVVKTILRAGADAGRTISKETAVTLADVALNGLPKRAAAYSVDSLPKLSQSLRTQLGPWFP